MLRLFSLAVAATFVFSAPMAAQDVTRQVEVNDSFTLIDLKFEGAASGRYLAYWTVLRANGILEMCGIGLATGSGIAKPLRAKQRTATLFLNKKAVLQDIRFFAQARSANELKTGKANCRSSGAKASGSQAQITLQFER